VTETPLLIKTLAQVQTDVAAHTGSILYEAFRRVNISCSDCRYIENAELYDCLLPGYIEASKRFTRYQRARDGRWTCGSDLSPNDTNRPLRPYTARLLYQAYQDVQEYRTIMRPFRPCENCRKRFNPTGRIGLSDPSLPEIKELFDE